MCPFADYGPLLYSNLGFNTVQQLLIQSGWISVCPFGNWINALVVDKFGRTRMLSKISVPSITYLTPVQS
jgi:hypothetical protein